MMDSIRHQGSCARRMQPEEFPSYVRNALQLRFKATLLCVHSAFFFMKQSLR